MRKFLVYILDGGMIGLIVLAVVLVLYFQAPPSQSTVAGHETHRPSTEPAGEPNAVIAPPPVEFVPAKSAVAISPREDEALPVDEAQPPTMPSPPSTRSLQVIPSMILDEILKPVSLQAGSLLAQKAEAAPLPAEACAANLPTAARTNYAISDELEEIQAPVPTPEFEEPAQSPNSWRRQSGELSAKLPPRTLSSPSDERRGADAGEYEDGQPEDIFDLEQGCPDDDFECLESCQRRGGFFVGYEQTVLMPYFEDGRTFRPGLIGGNIAAASGDTSAGAGAGFPPADFDFALAPRAWVGFVTSGGLGARGRYWRYGDGSEISEVVFPGVTFPALGPIGAGPTVDIYDSVNGNLELEAIDLDIFQRLPFDSWLWTFGAGLRYGRVELDAHSNVEITAVARRADNMATITADSLARFYGLGPTLCLEVRRPIGSLTFSSLDNYRTGLNLFASGRATLLFGRLTTSNQLEINDTAGVTNPFTGLPPGMATTNSTERVDDLLTVFEAQVGVEFSHRLGRRARFFGRAALEAQIWQSAGGFPAASPSTPALGGVVPAGGPFAGTHGDLGLFGGAFALGMDY